MRWLHPEIGEARKVRRFAIFPITLGQETRWLEWVTIRQHWGYNGFSVEGWQDDWFED